MQEGSSEKPSKAELNLLNALKMITNKNDHSSTWLFRRVSVASQLNTQLFTCDELFKKAQHSLTSYFHMQLAIQSRSESASFKNLTLNLIVK